MPGKVENCGSGQFAADRAEGSFSTFEHARGMKAVSDGVRFRSHVGQRNESIRRR